MILLANSTLEGKFYFSQAPKVVDIPGTTTVGCSVEVAHIFLYGSETSKKDYSLPRDHPAPTQADGVDHRRPIQRVC
jgi:hypothetical protein